VSSAQPEADGLQRRLGPVDAAAIVISNVIGGGIFFVPVIVAQLVPHPSAMLGAWLAGGALAFAGAMAYAELGAMRPHAGGEYVYIRDAYGPLAAFLTGWTSFVAGFSGAVAASALALAGYLDHFVALGPRAHTVAALAAVLAFTLVHVRGLGPGALLQNVLALLKVSAIVILVVAGFTAARGDAGHFVSSEHASAVGWGLALVPVMFTYSGWNAAAYVAEEVRDPHRNVPLSLGLGTIAVVVLYLALNALFVYAMPVRELAALSGGSLMDSVADRLFGSAGGNLLALFAIVSIAASISAMVLAGPRVYFAMARDGVFVRAAGDVHPRFRTPAAAIVAQGIWSGVLVLSGTLSQLVAYTGFAVVLFAGIAVSAVFVLRRKDPDRPRPFSALGYPWAPGIFVLASAAMVVNEIWRNPRPAFAGIVLILAGVPVYYLMRRARTSAARAA
jgi:APA family basic amino acid/polyamine antiporter